MKKKLRKFFQLFGPGFITGASDDDPSGIATYAQTGAMFGYGQLWTALFSFPFMTVMQEMCGRIGLVTGKGLAGVIRHHYAKPLLFGAVMLLLIANSINIGANLGAMASAVRLLVDAPFVFLLLLITVITLILEIFVTYRVYARYLKYLAFALLAYVATAFVVRQDWSAVVMSTFIPSVSLSKEYLMNIVAILGTTISPYLFFWQASEEVEEEVAQKKLRIMGMGKPRLNTRAISRMRFDTALGMMFSNWIMFFIILTTASTLHLHGIHEIQTAAQAAEALRPLAGNFAFLIFALGIVGSGFLAVPVLAGSASYALAEAFGWREGLYLKLKQAHGFYGVITIATILGLLINFTPITPFAMLYYTAMINGIVAPPLMVIIMLISNNKKIMGKHTNTRVSNVLGWLITGFMFVAAGALLVSIVL